MPSFLFLNICILFIYFLFSVELTEVSFRYSPFKKGFLGVPLKSLCIDFVKNLHWWTLETHPDSILCYTCIRYLDTPFIFLLISYLISYQLR